MIVLPLNSKTSLETAVTLALIICGVAPARPAAIIVMYSPMLALAYVTLQHEKASDCRKSIPSLVLSSSIPPTKTRFTTPPSVIFLPMATIRSNAALRAFSEGSFVPRTASGISEGMTCKAEGGTKGSRFAYS